ncbi:rhomboid family intramembrane serine protease [Polaribacter pacificus]|nr:rhomboid family intramembrane serine protease [Polaribacter pacificus]
MTDFQQLTLWLNFCFFKGMKEPSKFSFFKPHILIPFLAIVSIWLIYAFEIYFDTSFNHFGIYPRKFIGLRGLLTAPFIHGDAMHVFNNAVPLFVLLSCLVYFYKDVYKSVLVYGGLLSGFLTWLFAREAYHIGASGIVYLLFSFVFFSGLIKKQYQLVAVSLVVIFLYGSMVWYVLPIEDGISWEGHLSGFLSGLLFAFYFREKGIIQKRVEFQETEFDLLFDEDGNFNPPNNSNDELETD